jgi:two-component system response regulator (stage 0 sporulation protein A)
MVFYKIFIVNFDSKIIAEFSDVIHENGKFTLCGAAQNGYEAIEKIKTAMPDFVVLSDVIPGHDAFGIIKEIRKSCPFIPSFIMLSFSHDESLIRYAASIGVSSFFIYPFKFSDVLDRMIGLKNSTNLHRITLENSKMESSSTYDSQTKNISYMLLKLGIPVNMRGYRYLKTSIELCVNDPEIFENGITKFLYPLVAKIHNTTSECVERSIRNAISSAWKNMDFKNHDELFGFSYFSHRPTNSQFLALVIQRAKFEANLVM